MKELKFSIISTMLDGVVETDINGKRYTFIIDGAMLPRLRGIMRKSPGKALAFIRKHSLSVPRLCPVCGGFTLMRKITQPVLPFPDPVVGNIYHNCEVCDGKGTI